MQKEILRQRAIELRNGATPPEKLLWLCLCKRQLDGWKFRRQHTIKNYIVDFICLEKKLIVELDGGQHNSDKAERYDTRRTKELERLGYRVIRFWNNDVMNNLVGVVDAIYDELVGDDS